MTEIGVFNPTLNGENRPTLTLILDSERQLYSTAKTILFNDQDCADAIQETIVKAFAKIETLRNDRYARTWLIRILINECYTFLRKSSRFVPLEGMRETTELPYMYLNLNGEGGALEFTDTVLGSGVADIRQ